MGVKGPCVHEVTIPLPWNTTVTPHFSETPRGSSHSQEELGLPRHTSGAGSALWPLKSNSKANRQEIREVADLLEDTQLARLSCAQFSEFMTNW